MDCTHLQTCRGINLFGEKIVAQIKRKAYIFIFCTWVWRNIGEDHRILEYDAVSIDEGLEESHVSTHFES